MQLRIVKKQIIAILLALSIPVCCLSGCSSNKVATAQTIVATTTTQDSTSETSTGAEQTADVSTETDVNKTTTAKSNTTTTKKSSSMSGNYSNSNSTKTVDFTSLKSQNSEIFGWITVGGTKVDYPLCQSQSNDFFYLKHDAYTKASSDKGSIYIELVNSRDFSDSITVIYGHTGYSDTMFTTLHYFEDEDFFNSHEYFYIYLPDKTLKYQIISAFRYDNRHIMNTFDFTSSSDLSEFQNTLMNPNSSIKNVRTDLDVTIDADSKIVVMSTCMQLKVDEYRYLVSGVLVDTIEK